MKRLLIIDDDEELCAELGEMLRREGFDVDIVFDGARGESLIGLGRYHLVILDLKLPGMTGYEVLRKVRQRAASIKIFVLSGRPIGGPLGRGDGNDYQKEHEEDILSMADAVMNKPFAVDIFLNKVRELAV